MSKPVPPLLLLLIGAALLRITVGSDVYLRYVKEGLWSLLILSGVLLVGLGVAGLVSAVADRLRQPVMQLRHDANGKPYWHDPARDAHHAHGHGHGEGDADGHGHGHGHGAPRVAWLLAVPALSLLLFAPPALGSFTAARDGATAAAEVTTYAELENQPTVPMKMAEFIGRSVNDNWSIRGRKVKVMGFVTPGDRPGTWYLSRLTVNCCAADARPMRIEIHGAAAPPTDSWAAVTGLWRPTDVDPDNPLPQLDAGEVEPVSAPRNPYADEAPAGAGAAGRSGA
ncbi:TIGR03943 family putative permease subunit [Streptomyces vilmorinianum]|uniref:TIGR03943 family putative permease subunit n=1 Tax=Streptomyces vilmorinianum TaxID=3051092 RepID=UPI0010FB99F5|nr:TIGR03943 family protein [Streptomyces vilmorinianum]